MTAARDTDHQTGARQTANDELLARYATALMPNYGTPSVAIVRGRGVHVWDADGREYVDMFAGIAVSALGHAHPALVEAVSRQVAAIAHTSNLFAHEPAVELAHRLLRLLGGDGRVFFANSGSEANEAAFKLVRKSTGADRSYVVAAQNGFHGRTMGSLALTGKEAIREPFAPFGVDVRFVPYGDAAALTEAVTTRCAGVFLEPALGEGGVVPPPAGYLAAAREICDATGAIFVLDEIQSGVGRTGTWFAHEHERVRPDVLTLAKGLGGGLPIGACIGLGDYGQVFAPGDHGSTFGGNPVSCAAALAVLDTIEREGLLEHATTVGALLHDELSALSHPLLDHVRGSGLWLALVLTAPVAKAVEATARDAGFLVNAVAPDAIRLAPPLVLGAADARAFTAALPQVLDRASENRASENRASENRAGERDRT